MSTRSTPLFLALCLALCAVVNGPAKGAQGLLLISADGRYALAKADARGIHTVASTSTRATYGQSRALVALLSRDNATTSRFQAYDKTTFRPVYEWSAPGLPASQLSGASPDVVLTDRYAYFITIINTPQGPRAGPGLTPFDFHRLTLADSSLQTVPLPLGCANPRLTSIDGAPYLYSWDGETVWKYETTSGKFVTVVSSDDLDESSIASASAIPQPSLPPVSDYAIVPQAGIFRLSREGTLKQIVQSDLISFPTNVPAIGIPSAGKVLRLYTGPDQKRPTIGLLKQLPGEKQFYSLDAMTRKVQWSAVVRQSVAIDSVQIGGDGAVYYVDADTVTVLRTLKESTREVWDLRMAGGSVDGQATRILSVTTSAEVHAAEQ